jgi:hypothetical protein
MALNLSLGKIQIVGFATWIIEPGYNRAWGFRIRNRTFCAAFAVDDASTIL